MKKRSGQSLPQDGSQAKNISRRAELRPDVGLAEESQLKELTKAFCALTVVEIRFVVCLEVSNGVCVLVSPLLDCHAISSRHCYYMIRY